MEVISINAKTLLFTSLISDRDYSMPNICLRLPFPGPIAMVMDRNSIIPLAKGKAEQTQSMLYIRSAAGELVIYHSLKPAIS